MLCREALLQFIVFTEGLLEEFREAIADLPAVEQKGYFPRGEKYSNRVFCFPRWYIHPAGKP
jgi:hypothetical protein